MESAASLVKAGLSASLVCYGRNENTTGDRLGYWGSLGAGLFSLALLRKREALAKPSML